MKILYVTTVGGTMSFFSDLIRELLAQGDTVDIATNEDISAVPQVYRNMGCRIHHIDCTRSPFNKGNWRAIGQIKRLVSEERYDVVHCHTPIAAMCTRLACRGARKKGTKVFYTAHGFHFYQGAPLKNWLIFYPIEKACAHFTDVLLTMNQEDYARAQKSMKAKKIFYVPGVGIDLKRFQDVSISAEQKRKELKLPDGARMLLSVGELNTNKNHALVLRAMAQLRESDFHYVIAGEGEQRQCLLSLAKELGVEDRLHLLGHRRDIAELCTAAELFCFPSFREGLPVSIMEAMACGRPVVCGRIRGNVDLIDENGGAWFDPHDVDSCRQAIETILQKDLRAMGEYNLNKIQGFSTEVVIEQMKALYRENGI